MAEAYVPRPHIVRDHGVLVHPGRNARIKRYTMMPEGERDFSRDEREAVDEQIIKKISQGKIYSGLGLGFSILSDGIVNVAMWGGKFPSLLNQAVYSFKRENMLDTNPRFKPESLDEMGTFCAWETAIVGHEGAAWRHYLLSDQAERDRAFYLSDQFEGISG